jgi:lysophospholipase L1-like esterase
MSGVPIAAQHPGLASRFIGQRIGTSTSEGDTMPSRRLLALVSVAALSLLPASAPAATPPVPGSMAALGDSITRAFNACGFYVDCPSRSWSTGTAVNSHYLRIQVKNPAITGRNYNDASSGAEMADLTTQAQAAVAQNVDYVTILIGANDACASTETGMTPVSTFESQFRQALTTLTSGLPNAAIFVASIPDLKRLWEIGRTSFWARTAWSLYQICQSMLARPLSTASADIERRERVRQRVVDYNAVLARVCSEHSVCDFDDNTVFNYRFTLAQVSGWDYFHPNTNGQQVLAEITYGAGFGW